MFTYPMPVDFQLDRQAHVTNGTMEEAILAAHPANSASVAMVLVLVLVIK